MIIPPPLAGPTTMPPAAIAGQAYSFAIQVSGGTAPYTLTESSGLFPMGQGAAGTPCQGLMVNFTTGAVTGAPVNTGTCGPVNFQVQDASIPAQTFQFSLSFRVVGALTISAATLPNGAEGLAYNQTVATSGGATPITFSISAGALPPGLMLNVTSGAITGTPTMGGTFNFTVRVTDSLSPAQAAMQALTVLILQVTTASLPDGNEGVAYNQSLAVTGEVAPVNWTLAAGSGPLPPGLMLDADGVISGTPTAAGTFSFTVQAGDSDMPARTHTRSLSITINPAPAAPSITSSTIPNGVFDTAYTQTIMTSGGVGPLMFAIVLGSLPPGINLDPNSGVISGTPTAGGTFPITVEVADSSTPAQTDSQAYTLLILQITTQSLPNGLEGQPYDQSLGVTGEILPVAWTLAAGSGPLPPGLMLTLGGDITGTPTQPGTFNFLVQVADADTPPRSDVQALSITVDPAIDLSITKTDAPDPIELGQGNVTYIITVTNNSPTPATDVVVTDTLPVSFTFVSVVPAAPCIVNGQVITCNLGVLTNAASALITIVAAPTAAGTFTNSVNVTNPEFDPDLANNSASTDTVVTNPVPPPPDISDIHVTRTSGTGPFSAVITFRHDAVANTLVFRMPPPPATFPIPYTETQPGPIVGDNSLIAVGEFDNFDLDFTDGSVSFFTGDGMGNFTFSHLIPLGAAIRALAFDPSKSFLFVSYTAPFEERLTVINVVTRSVVGTLVPGMAFNSLLANPDPSLRFLYSLGPGFTDTMGGLDDVMIWFYDQNGNLAFQSQHDLPFPNNFAIKNQRLYIGTNASAGGMNPGFQHVINLVAGLPAGSNALGPVGGGGLFGEAVVRDSATGEVCKYAVDGIGNLRIFFVDEATLAITESLFSPFSALPGENFFLPLAHPTKPIIYVLGAGNFDPDGPGGPIPPIFGSVIDVFNVDTLTCSLSNPVPGGLRNLIPGPPGPPLGALAVPQ